MKNIVPHISLIIPVFNEEQSIPELIDDCIRVFGKNELSYEIILVDDGSKDNSWKNIVKLSKKNKHIRGYRLLKNYGKSACLQIGFEKSKGKYVFTMDGDLQDDPREIPQILSMLSKGSYDLVSGWKKERYDNFWTKNLPSKIFNTTTRLISKVRLHDFNCGIKGYKAEVTKNLDLYSDMHRYIPVLAKMNGYDRIGEKVVTHRKRKYGQSKFGVSRFFNGIIDLILIMFMNKFGKKPIQFFGMLGLCFIILGISILVYLSIGKFIFHEYKMTDRPVFYVAIVSTIIGFQTFLSGFVAELILRHSKNKHSYTIKDSI